MPGPVRWFIFAASAALVPTCLYFGRELLIPLALAALLSFLLARPVRSLERLRIGRVAAVLAVVSVATAVLAGLAWLVATEAGNVMRDFSTYRDNVEGKIHSASHALRSTFSHWTGAIETLSESDARPTATGAAPTEPGPVLEPASQPMLVELAPPRDGLLRTLLTYGGPVVHPLATAAVTAVFVIFFLVFQEDIRDRIIRICGRAQINVTTTALTESGRRVTRYLGAQALANGAIGLAIGVGLWLMGIPNPALWGLLAAVLRFVPFIGATVAGFFPVAQAVAISEGWGLALMALLWIVLVDMASANFLEPWLFGSRTGASPTAVVLAFVVWTWLWGAIGMLLAMPITVCLVVLGKQIPALEWLHVLLGDEPVLEPHVRLYQRLLARDHWQAQQLVRDYAARHSAEEACDEVIIPALALLQHDGWAGTAPDECLTAARTTILKLIDELPFAERATPGLESLPPDYVIVLDRGVFDDLVPPILERVAATHIPAARVLSRDSLATEVVQRIRSLRPAVVVLTAIEPRDGTRMRHIWRRLPSLQRGGKLLGAIFSTRPDSAPAGWATSMQFNPPLREVLAMLRATPGHAPGPARRAQATMDGEQERLTAGQASPFAGAPFASH